jgi:hypothetical protein
MKQSVKSVWKTPMDKIARWSDNQRSELFQQTATNRGMVPAIIEKDFWVCWVLGKLFADDVLHSKIMFKGGTSLSKVFGLIERFSEDIDLALNWNEVITEDPFLVRSKKKQRQFNESAREAARQYLNEQFLPKVQKLIEGVCEATIREDTPNVIDISYPAAFEKEYLRPEILLEIGLFAAWIPNAKYKIRPYSAEEFPSQFENPTCRVWAIKAERTFWEKVTILHHEAHRPETSAVPARHSRHYYDLVVMSRSPVKKLAFDDLSLLRAVVEFKQKFYPRGWARYDLAEEPVTLKLVPPEHILRSLRRDYRDMQIMIFGETPEFDEIISALDELEQEINELKD